MDNFHTTTSRFDSLVKLLVGSDGSVLRAELYYAYWDDRSSGKKPS